MIDVQSNGAANIVVDEGRAGFMEIGVTCSGPMDALALHLANALLGNDARAAAIEVGFFPFRLTFQADTFVAVTGVACEATLGDRPLPPCWARRVRAGESLSLRPPAQGARAYVAVAGGIDVPLVLGSRSTELKTSFGGHEGRGLKRGDRLSIGNAQTAQGMRPRYGAGFGVAPQTLQRFWRELASGTVALRVLPAAEYEEFTAQAREQFVGTSYRITPESNRTGSRLEGEPLERATKRELLSHGIVPGTVQVPPSGQPIVQLVEANTCGGYPKIATVIEADLWKFGQLTPGTRVSFRLVDADEAIQALQQCTAQLQDLSTTLSLLAERRDPH